MYAKSFARTFASARRLWQKYMCRPPHRMRRFGRIDAGCGSATVTSAATRAGSSAAAA
jgi:hypothetical protein